jgi:hypothetical protein
MLSVAPAVQPARQITVPNKAPKPEPAASISSEAPGRASAASSVCTRKTASVAVTG